ncbi:MAG: bifunctional oligoribonuclease/PAP phosphatase NrnA [Patescibacteria group bacterium]
MHYQQSSKILEIIKNFNNILINVHRNPDLDSVGSATALYQALIKMGKKVTLVCPHKIPENFKFLKGADKVVTFDFTNFINLTNLINSFDLFLILDSGSYDIVTGSKEIKLPDIKKIIIDHHLTNNWTDYVYRLLDTKASATAEIVYGMLKDWRVDIDGDISTSLLSGIAGDTVFFKYPKDPAVTFSNVSELMKLGADYNLLIEKFNDSLSFGFVKLLGEFLKNMKQGAGFVWSAVDYITFEKYGKPRGVRETVADSFFRSIKNIKFGVALIEEEKGKFAVSFRSKKNTDVSVIAKKLGGGGHKNAAGATIYGRIDQVIEKIKKII